MSLEFNEDNLIDLCELVTDGSHHSPPSQVKGYYMASVKDMGTYKFNYSDCRKISEEDYNKLVKSGCSPKNDDILIAKDGSPLSNIFIYKEEYPMVLLSSIAIIRANKNKILPEFLKYYLENHSIKRYIQTTYTSGSVIPRIILKDFKKFPIIYPNMENQKKIIGILRTIDKKIAINEEINQNLEEQLETLYNSFFVYYDDFLKEDLKECEIGLIPKEWSLLSLGEVTTKINEKVGSNDYKVFSAVNTGNLILSEEYFDKQVYSKSIEKYIVVKQKEFAYNPARINIGSIGRNNFDFDGCVSPVYVAFKVEEGYENFMNMYIKSNRFNQWVITLSSGSVRQTLNYNDFSIIKIAYPPKELINKFNTIYESYYEVINYNKSVINNLEKIRDLLLPKLMSGEIDVSKINYDLKNMINNFNIISLNLFNKGINMKTKIISKIQNQMKPYLNQGQYIKLTNSLLNSLQDIDIIDNNNDLSEVDNLKLLKLFLSAKEVEGCSEKTILYYKSTIEKMLMKIKKQVYNINTDDLRKYLYDYKYGNKSSKTTIDNIRRIFSSFFAWLEEEDYIIKNPVRRIHRVKTGRVVKETLTDENLEVLRDNCEEIRDLAIVELLISTGIRVGELVRLNINDVDFYERECIVFGKGESERVVYFDARTKIHLIEYLQSRVDENPALFVSLNEPYNRLGISGVETRLRELGKKCNINKVHPHKFRRTMATNAIDKGMPIEQVQRLLGHLQIDTTMQYAMVNQSNVKLAHRKFIG